MAFSMRASAPLMLYRLARSSKSPRPMSQFLLHKVMLRVFVELDNHGDISRCRCGDLAGITFARLRIKVDVCQTVEGGQFPCADTVDFRPFVEHLVAPVVRQ